MQICSFALAASVIVIVGIGTATAGSVSDDKLAEMAVRGLMKRDTAPVTLSNGTGDGRLTVTVDGYGSFGSTTPAGDVSYDPVGPIAASGAVWESAILFSPTLSTGTMHVQEGLPPVEIKVVNSRVATSEFSIGDYSFKLRQEILPPKGNGSELVQTYKITNLSSAGRIVKISRYLEGDLYFVGSFGNDFGGVTADGRTVYQFDTGDDATAPTTFVGITSTGGRPVGYAVQPYRFTDPVVALGEIPAAIRNTVYDDADHDRVSDNGFDAGMIQQNNITIPPKGVATYVTRTRFGSGSIVSQVSQVSGCVTLNGQPAANRAVEVRQPGSAVRKVRTDSEGCYDINGLKTAKTADIVIKLPAISP